MLNFELRHLSSKWAIYRLVNGMIFPENWGGRNEVIETSGRLRSLRPQNKRLHSPRTTDRQHTRQDRWIQEELAFTPAKNATIPNPFKIISLQPTRKENSWETEETMERATVTLETERAKWPNPGCLWRWWFSGKRILKIECVVWYNLILLSETFLILAITERDITINVHKYSCKVPDNFDWF
jgi:hypothetical protein